MCQLDIFNLTICQHCDGDLTAVFQEPERPTKIMNAHIEKAGLDDLQIVKALGAGGFGLVKLVKVKGQFRNFRTTLKNGVRLKNN